jgi:hypothetical protein
MLFAQKIANIRCPKHISKLFQRQYIGQTFAAFPLADGLRGHVHQTRQSALRIARVFAAVPDALPDYIVVHKPAFNNGPISGLIKQDLPKSGSNGAFAKILSPLSMSKVQRIRCILYTSDITAAQNFCRLTDLDHFLGNTTIKPELWSARIRKGI